MTPRQYSLRLLMIAALAICAGAWWWSGQDNGVATSPPTASSTPATEAIPAPALPDTPGAITVPSAKVAAMPARDTALRDAAHPLQARADGGDSKAACRLGVELLRCAKLETPVPEHDEWLARQEAEYEAAGRLELANATALARMARLQIRQECAGIPPALIQQAHHYVRKAALAGEPEAMIRYAAGETLGGWGFSAIATPRFDQWRQEARQVLMRALEAGTPEAPLLLMASHGQAGFLPMLLPRDDVGARASQALARRLYGDDPAFAALMLDDTLDASLAAQADALAAQWHERHFGNATLVLADSTGALLPLRNSTEVMTDAPPFPGTPRQFACEPSGAVAP